jgi:hypothetical protein
MNLPSPLGMNGRAQTLNHVKPLRPKLLDEPNRGVVKPFSRPDKEIRKSAHGVIITINRRGAMMLTQILNGIYRQFLEAAPSRHFEPGSKASTS